MENPMLIFMNFVEIWPNHLFKGEIVEIVEDRPYKSQQGNHHLDALLRENLEQSALAGPCVEEIEQQNEEMPYQNALFLPDFLGLLVLVVQFDPLYVDFH